MVVRLFGLAVAAAGALFVLVAFSYVGAYLRILRADQTDVAAVDGGMDVVELAGTARPIDEPFASKFEDVDTLINMWDVAERRGSGENRSWRSQESGQDVAPFLLDDGTGQIVVDPRGAEWILGEDCNYTTDDDTPPPAEIGAFLDEVGRTPNVEKSGRTYRRRYKETRLDDGDDVYVYGPVKSGPAEDAPAGAVDPYVGTDSTGDVDVNDRTSMQLSPEIFPFVGDPDATFAVGGADESGLFTISDATESTARRRFLKRGLIVAVFGLFFFAVGLLFLGIVPV